MPSGKPGGNPGLSYLGPSGRLTGAKKILASRFERRFSRSQVGPFALSRKNVIES